MKYSLKVFFILTCMMFYQMSIYDFFPYVDFVFLMLLAFSLYADYRNLVVFVLLFGFFGDILSGNRFTLVFIYSLCIFLFRYVNDYLHIQKNKRIFVFFPFVFLYNNIIIFSLIQDFSFSSYILFQLVNLVFALLVYFLKNLCLTIPLED